MAAIIRHLHFFQQWASHDTTGHSAKSTLPHQGGSRENLLLVRVWQEQEPAALRGSHKDTGFVPVAYTASLTGEVYFCGCKASKNNPLCDGSHKSL